VDVNLGEGSKPRIVVYENDSPRGVVHEFAVEHELDEDAEESLLKSV
jgi:hypothetical protein